MSVIKDPQTETSRVAVVRRAIGSQLRVFAVAATAILLATTLCTHAARSFWVADLLANLRTQQVLGLLACLVFHVAFRSWKLLAVSVVGLLVHLPVFVSDYVYCQAASGAAHSGLDHTAQATLSLTTANVLTTNRRYADIANELLTLNSDLVAVIEISSGLHDHLSGNFSRVYPYSVFYVQDSGNFGIALYSKLPWSNAALTAFNDDSLKSVVATINHGGHRWHIIATHTLPPIGRRNYEHRNQHLKLLSDEVNRLRLGDSSPHVVVMGDLNITPWSPIFQDFAAEANLRRDTVSFGLRPTWFRFPTFAFGLVLDHVLTTGGISCLNYTVSPDVGSDHRFVTVELAP